MTFIDTHTHIDGEEFNSDREAVIERAKAAGVCKMFVPAIDLKSLASVNEVCSAHPHYAYPMIGLHPEEVRADWHAVLDEMHAMLSARHGYIAIGEVGLDYYWSRDFAEEQFAAFEEQVRWSMETRLPLMIHCRKAQNEMVAVLRRYADDLPGGVFHCFTGNRQEAAELLSF
ncbi:MAG: TatD family hydrolase, partial [Prevotella sp.]|nr:TatD family hydrolase [Prevotella sp.]